MKVPKDFELRKRMARIAKPCLESVLYKETPEKRKEILRKVIRNIRARDGDMGVSRLGKIFLKPLLKNIGAFGHELMHSIRGYLNNDYILASAVQTYLNNLGPYFNYGDIETLKTRPFSNPKNLRPLSLYEKLEHDTEYSRKHNSTGYSLGCRAIYVECATKTPGSGLFYLKLVDLGYSPDEAEHKIMTENIPEMEQFKEKYGKRIRKMTGCKTGDQK